MRWANLDSRLWRAQRARRNVDGGGERSDSRGCASEASKSKNGGFGVCEQEKFWRGVGGASDADADADVDADADADATNIRDC